MLRALFFVAASAPLLACSASMRRGVSTTEAATAMQQVTYSQANERDPAVSPDAKSIAYEVADSPGATPHLEVALLGSVSVGAGAGRPAEVRYSSKDATGLEPAWMPDGSGVVFVSNALGSPGLVQTSGTSLDGNSFLAHAGDPGFSASWPALSPDGKSMAMTLPRTRLFESGWKATERFRSALGLSDLSGSGLTILGEGTEPAWSPHGDRLAFVRDAGGHSHVFVAKADGTGARQVTDGPDDDRQPAWSPDGSSLAFCSVHDDKQDGHGGAPSHSNLFVVHADGSGLAQLTEGDRTACRPDWASDGFIYFHADATDRFHIWRLKPRAWTSTWRP
jgi:Tol biopolymer transport system component